MLTAASSPNGLQLTNLPTLGFSVPCKGPRRLLDFFLGDLGSVQRPREPARHAAHVASWRLLKARALQRRF